MQNQMTKNNLYESIKMSEDELMHYGILGMHWGIRRYQDYGEGGYDPDHEGRFVGEKVSKKEMKAQAEKEKRLRKMREAAAKKRKAEVKAAKKQEKIDKMKSKLIQKGDMDKIYKKRKYFTTEELEYARARNQELIETKNTKNAKKAPDPHKMERVLNLVSRVGQVAAAAVPVLDAVSRYKQIQQSDLNMELSKMRSMNDATTSKIETLMKLDPKAAAAYTSRIFGTEIEYSPKKEAPKPGDVKTMSEAIAKIDKNAAARYLSDVTGYKVSGDAQGANIPDSKKVKGNLGDLQSRKLGSNEIASLLNRRNSRSSNGSANPTWGASDKYSSNRYEGGGISDSTKNSILSLIGNKSKSSKDISKSQYSFDFGGKSVKSSFTPAVNTAISGILEINKSKPVSQVTPKPYGASDSDYARWKGRHFSWDSATPSKPVSQVTPNPYGASDSDYSRWKGSPGMFRSGVSSQQNHQSVTPSNDKKWPKKFGYNWNA